jgi:hypothetical protein
MGCDFSKNEVAHRGAYPRSAFDPSVFQKPQNPRGAKRSINGGTAVNPLTGAAMRQAMDRSVASVPGLLATSSCTERAAAAAAASGVLGDPALINSGVSATESAALGVMRSDHTAADVAAVGSASFMTLGPRGGGRNALDMLSQRRSLAASMAGSRIRGETSSEYNNNNDVTSRFGQSDADAISWGGHDGLSPQGPDLDATAMTARSVGRASFRSMGASGIRGGGIRFIPSRSGFEDDDAGDVTPSPSSDGLPPVPVVRTWQPLQPEAFGAANGAPAADVNVVVVAAPGVAEPPPTAVPEAASRAARALPPVDAEDGRHVAAPVLPPPDSSLLHRGPVAASCSPADAAPLPPSNLRATEAAQLGMGDGRSNIQDWVAEVAEAGHLDVYPPLEDVQW